MNEFVTRTFSSGSWPRPQYPILQARREKTAPAHGVKVSALTTRRIGAAPRGDEGVVQRRQSNQLDHPAPPADFLFERSDCGQAYPHAIAETEHYEVVEGWANERPFRGRGQGRADELAEQAAGDVVRVQRLGCRGVPSSHRGKRAG
jgi:hypothetical protein